MKNIILLTLTSLTGTLLFSQSTFKKNDIYLEAGGNGLFGSLNYERQLTNRPGIGARLGIGFYSENALYITVPAGINYLFTTKNNKSFVDAGIGATWTRIDGKLFGDSKNPNGSHFVNFAPGIGYRRHTTRDMMWRISITPVINKYGFAPWIGFSLGKRF